MELSLERKPITVNETILDINTEQAVESDMLLADYYPRISRILRCCVETSVDQAVVSGERLIVDGVALCRVFYKSEEGRPASVTVTSPIPRQWSCAGPRRSRRSRCSPIRDISAAGL